MHESFQKYVNNGKLGFAGCAATIDYAMGFIECLAKVLLCGSEFAQLNTGVLTQVSPPLRQGLPHSLLNLYGCLLDLLFLIIGGPP